MALEKFDYYYYTIYVFSFFSSVGLVKFYLIFFCLPLFFFHIFMLPIGEMKMNVFTFKQGQNLNCFRSC